MIYRIKNAPTLRRKYATGWPVLVTRHTHIHNWKIYDDISVWYAHGKKLISKWICIYIVCILLGWECHSNAYNRNDKATHRKNRKKESKRAKNYYYCRWNYLLSHWKFFWCASRPVAIECGTCGAMARCETWPLSTLCRYGVDGGYIGSNLWITDNW